MPTWPRVGAAGRHGCRFTLGDAAKRLSLLIKALPPARHACRLLWDPAGEKVVIPGFGTFEQRVRAARRGRNPRTGEELQIPESKSPAFSAGKTFKDSVKSGKLPTK